MPIRTVLSVSKRDRYMAGPRWETGSESDAGSPSGPQMGLDRSGHRLWPGLCLLMIDVSAQSIVKEPEQMILHQLVWLSISSDQGTHFTHHNVQK